MEGYFSLLEHEEIQQARESSSVAKRIAMAEIVISVALAAVVNNLLLVFI